MTYRIYASALSGDADAPIDADVALIHRDHAQEAVDAARAIVREYSGDGLPRAVVTRESGKRKLIFRAWRKPDGMYAEARMDGKVTEAGK